MNRPALIACRIDARNFGHSCQLSEKPFIMNTNIEVRLKADYPLGCYDRTYAAAPPPCPSYPGSHLGLRWRPMISRGAPRVRAISLIEDDGDQRYSAHLRGKTST